MTDPALFPRRILLATIGLTPQIITETLYVLCAIEEKDKPPFVPDEIHILTTSEGAHRVRQTLLEPSQAHLAKFAHEFGFPALASALKLEFIHVIHDRPGTPLKDILSGEHNAEAANLTIDTVRKLTGKDYEDAALHVSIAGGRKTMGFLLGSAMTLFGRPQDRLSHVLVEPSPLEQHPEFFYKPKEPRVLYDMRDKNRPINTADAKIMLADIKFVRLREGLPEQLLNGTWSHSETVERAQEALSPRLVVDCANQRISCQGRAFGVSAMQFALYEILAHARTADPEGEGFLHWAEIDGDDFISRVERLPRVQPHELARLKRDFAKIGHADYLGENDPRKTKFEQAKTRMNERLEKQLGPYFAAYKIKQKYCPKGQKKLMGLGLAASAISFAPLPLEVETEEIGEAEA